MEENNEDKFSKFIKMSLEDFAHLISFKTSIIKHFDQTIHIVTISYFTRSTIFSYMVSTYEDIILLRRVVSKTFSSTGPQEDIQVNEKINYPDYNFSKFKIKEELKFFKLSICQTDSSIFEEKAIWENIMEKSDYKKSLVKNFFLSKKQPQKEIVDLKKIQKYLENITSNINDLRNYIFIDKETYEFICKNVDLIITFVFKEVSLPSKMMEILEQVDLFTTLTKTAIYRQTHDFYQKEINPEYEPLEYPDKSLKELLINLSQIDVELSLHEKLARLANLCY